MRTRRLWGWGWLACCAPALAFAQGAGGRADQPEERRQPSVQRQPIAAEAVVLDPPQPVTRQNYGKSAEPPGPNEPIPVRRDFQPELQGSLSNLD